MKSESAVSEKQTSRRGRWAALAGGGLVVLLGAGYVGTAAAVTNKVPDGTKVAGVDVSGMSSTKAADAVEKHTSGLLSRPVTVNADGKSITLDPTKSGLSLDAGQGVDGLTGFSLSPTVVKEHLFGVTQDRPLKAKADLDKLAAAITAAGGTFKGSATNGSVRFDNGKVVVTRSTDGTGIQADAAARQIAAGWPAKTSFTATIGHVEAPLTNAELDAFVRDFANPAMSGPLKIKVGDKVAELTPQDVCEFLSAKVTDGKIEPVVDEAKLKSALDSLSNTLTTAPVNAHYGANGAIVEAKNGTEVDPTGAAALVVKALTATDRTVTLKTKPVAARMTAADLKNLGTTQISEFVSPYPTGPANAARTTNIKVALSKINGMIVAPGEQFSLLQALSPIEASNGYVEAGVLIDGRHGKGTGGGISQVSTTLYNATFFAGVQLDEHTEHAYWIPRYPMGREATLWVPTIDNKWTNDTGHPIRIQAGTEGNAAVIRLFGTKTFNVKTTTGPQFAFTDPKTRYLDESGCEPQTPAQGFSVTVTRTVTDLSGKVVKSESRTTKYIPQDRVICGPDPSKARASSSATSSRKPTNSSTSTSSTTAKPSSTSTPATPSSTKK